MGEIGSDPGFAGVIFRLIGASLPTRNEAPLGGDSANKCFKLASVLFPGVKFMKPRGGPKTGHQ